MNDVLGHEEAKDCLQRTLLRGRLASTYLFVGPEGIGKRFFAERLAAALLCTGDRPDEITACGVCHSCQMTAGGTHPDLLRVKRPEGKTTLPVDLFLGPADRRNREGLCHEIALKPLVADRRVAVIDDVDDFSVETANCLLKTLEEPPPRSLLILVGTSLSRQLPTIRSRSQVVRFTPLSDAQVAEVLTLEPHAMSPEEASRLATEAGGSVSRALSLSAGSLDEATVMLRKCLEAERLDGARLTKILEEESKAVATEPRIRRRALRELLATTITVFHRRLAESAEGSVPADRILEQLEACLDAEAALARNANQSAVVQVLAQRVSSASF